MPRDRTHPRLTLASMLAVQVVGSMCLAAPPVLAPAAAFIIGFAPERLGLYMAVAFLAAMASGLLSGTFVVSLGGVRISQLALLILGVAAYAAIASNESWILMTALLLGTGYGMINPSSAILLSRNSPQTAVGLYFSIKQAGVPLGVAIAGTALPWAMVAFGWTPVLASLGLWCFIGVGALVAVRSRLEHLDLRVVTASKTARPLDVSVILRDAGLRQLATCAFVLELAQVSLVTFLVSYLHLELAFPLPLAAGILALSQAVSTLARIGWGYAGDRWFAPLRLVATLALGSGLALAATGGLVLLPPLLTSDDGGSPLILATVIAASTLCALTAMGWNGVFFAELARRTSPESVPAVTGAIQMVSFLGCISGPLLVGEIVTRGGSFSAAFLALAPIPVLVGARLLLGKRFADA